MGRARIVVAACAMGLGGCISSDVAVVEPGPTDDAPVAVERTAVGEQVTTVEGNEVTVHRVAAPREVPGSDVEVLDVEVEICAARDGEGAASSPAYFRALVTDEGHRRAAPPVERPALPEGRLDVGDCARGWIGFPIRPGEEVQGIVLLASSTVEWALP